MLVVEARRHSCKRENAIWYNATRKNQARNHWDIGNSQPTRQPSWLRSRTRTPNAKRIPNSRSTTPTPQQPQQPTETTSRPFLAHLHKLLLALQLLLVGAPHALLDPRLVVRLQVGHGVLALLLPLRQALALGHGARLEADPARLVGGLAPQRGARSALGQVRGTGRGDAALGFEVCLTALGVAVCGCIGGMGGETGMAIVMC